MSVSVVLCTLVLNELQWLSKLYAQSRDWPGMKKWVFVEAADRVYSRTNPDMVSPDGLSVDGTTAFLRQLARQDSRVVHIKHGFSEHADPAQCKCAARSRYLRVADEVEPTFVYVLDSDEFVPRESQERILSAMRVNPRGLAFCFRQRHIWHPPIFSDEPLFRYEAIGGFWAIPHCRGWRWQPGLRYETNHNTPEDSEGRLLDRKMIRFDEMEGRPEVVHMGFASSKRTRLAKNAYYAARGESTGRRSWYVESRAAFETWRPGDKLPRGARIAFYDGVIPECFQE